jgi:NADP-dependent 3-hydroxy acid dehydrogenase YdfG
MTAQTILITGATSGIGQALARRFTGTGSRLILCGRRAERLDALQRSVGGSIPVKTLCFDIGVREEVERAWASVPEEWRAVNLLVNNAGGAHGLAPIHEGDPADWDAMIDANLRGVLSVTRLVTPGMVARRSGHIINIGSIAAKEPYGLGNVYCATKAAIDALTRSMRLDLHRYHIRVTAIHPGLVESEFSLVRFKGDAERARKVYEGMTALRPDDVAEAIWFVFNQPPHVTVADLVVLPTAQAGSVEVHRSLPQCT